MVAALDRGITAHAEPNDEGIIRIISDGFAAPIEVELNKLWPDEKEQGTPTALVRGMAGVLAESIGKLRGFDAVFYSDLPTGRGLSSSAAFCVLVGYILTAFSQDEPLPPEELARAAQKAESRWYGRPCALVDHMVCTLGGAVYMDVLENKLLSIQMEPEALGLAMCMTYTGESHVPTDNLAQITADMSEVAQHFGEPVLARVRMTAFDEQWPDHKDDPKWMRARHFFDESWRVASMSDALGLRDGQRYMDLMNESGRSSERLLRNIHAEGTGDGLARGLAASAELLRGRGAWRVHGGGFVGYVQALMPEAELTAYQAVMDGMFGPGACQRVHISTQGVRQTGGDPPRERRGFPEEATSLLDDVSIEL